MGFDLSELMVAAFSYTRQSRTEPQTQTLPKVWIILSAVKDYLGVGQILHH